MYFSQVLLFEYIFDHKIVLDNKLSEKNTHSFYTPGFQLEGDWLGNPVF